MDQAKNAASFAPLTAARPGRKCSSRTTRRARLMSFSIRQIRQHFLPRSGRFIAHPGVSRVAARAAVSTNRSKAGGLYRSDDGGDNWIKMNDDGRLRQRAWYFTHIFADPKSPDTLYVLNTGLFRSIDGGRTFNLLNAPHGDHHGLWIDPDHPERLINGNDGGATISIDGGKTWSTQYNQPTAQFYHVITDNRWPYYIYGAQQDNSSIAIKSYHDDGGICRQDWYAVGGGESGYIAPYPPDPNIVFAGAEGFISRFDKRTAQPVDTSVRPVDVSANSARRLLHRFQWTAPLFISPHDPN